MRCEQPAKAKEAILLYMHYPGECIGSREPGFANRIRSMKRKKQFGKGLCSHLDIIERVEVLLHLIGTFWALLHHRSVLGEKLPFRLIITLPFQFIMLLAQMERVFV